VSHQYPHNKKLSQANEDEPGFTGFINKSEDEKLRENIFRSPLEKLRLFTRMLKRESLLKTLK